MKATRYASRLFLLSICLVLAVSLIPNRLSYATSADVVISQVYGGGGNAGATYKNDFVELFNRGSSAVSLTGWSIQYASATGTGNFGSNAIALINGTLQPGQYYLIQLAGGATGVALPTPDSTGSVNMSGSAGKVALVMSTTGLACNGGSTPCTPAQLAQIKDLVGYGGANFFETAPAPALNVTTSAMRNSDGCAETDNNSADFSAVTPPNPRNTASPVHICVADAAPAVSSATPSDGDSNVALAADLAVSFSEPVNVTTASFDLTCTPSGTHSFVLSGGPSDYTINPDVDFSLADTCTLTVFAAAVSDVDMDDPPDNMATDFTTNFTTVGFCELPFTPTYDIQGSGLSAAITGTVTTQGVVVGDFETTASASGFYLQDATGDSDTATSDGIFVYTGSSNFVNAGDVVRVTGYARERFNQTTLNGSDNNSAAVPKGNVINCGSGSLSPVDVSMPFESSTYLEQFEGMLVRFPQPLVISEYFNYDRFGEMVLSLPLDGQTRMYTPTSVVEPGAPALALAAENRLRRITLDDAQSTQNPPLLRHPNGQPFSLENLFRGGDIVQNAVGVLGYDFDLYRIVPTGPADFSAVNPRPAVPEDVGGRLQVAAMNTLNFFITLDYPKNDPRDNKCGPLQNVECRGADFDQPLEFERQRTKLLAALSGLDASVIGLNEIENTPGVEPLQSIVDGLNDIFGPGTYAYIDTGVIGSDAIRVGMIYRPADVTPVGDFKLLTTAVDPRFLDSKNRPVLAQTFSENSSGARFTMVVNHLKSKGSDCNDVGDPDLGDGQGNCNLTRKAAAEALVDWLATDPTGSGDPDFIIMGDLNSYAMEDPIDAIKAGPDDIADTADDYSNLVFNYQGLYAYSYVFDGQNGYLDQALANASMTDQVSGVADWHINADEPDVLDYDTSFKPDAQDALYEPNEYRTSDHDAVVVGLNLLSPAGNFITGGGWISSPAGAYVPDPTVTGKGEFSFDAKFVKNNPSPVGTVSYTVKNAGLYFTASSINWLAMYENAAWISGQGALNGADGYGFMLTAGDNPDTFRIQVWEASSGMLVYDSQLGDNKFAPATTTVGGGKIAIR